MKCYYHYYYISIIQYKKYYKSGINKIIKYDIFLRNKQIIKYYYHYYPITFERELPLENKVLLL